MQFLSLLRKPVDALLQFNDSGKISSSLRYSPILATTYAKISLTSTHAYHLSKILIFPTQALGLDNEALFKPCSMQKCRAHNEDLRDPP
jgi:hypothetical protein